METNVPNIDTLDDLMGFWAKHQNGRAYRQLFPAGGKGTKRAAADLANYAANLHAAKTTRMHGNIPGAHMYEIICTQIYNKLPTFARW